MVLARLSAVSRYTLYINGADVSRGPVRANPHRPPYDLVDLTPHLRTGDNVIGVIAWRYDGPTAWWLPPPPANDLQYGAFVFEAASAKAGWSATRPGPSPSSTDGVRRLRPASADAAPKSLTCAA